MSEQMQFIPGEDVYVVERDDCGEPAEVSGYMFLAAVGQAVILTPYINDLETLDETLDYLIDETRDSYDVDLAVFPLEDCYKTRDEAHAAMDEEVNK